MMKEYSKPTCIFLSKQQMDLMKNLRYLPALPEQPQRMMTPSFISSLPLIMSLPSLTLSQLSLSQDFGTSTMTQLHRRFICPKWDLTTSRPHVHCTPHIPLSLGFAHNVPRALIFAIHGSRALPRWLHVFIRLFHSQLVITVLTVSSL